MLKEKEVIHKGLTAFKECLSLAPSLKIASIDALPGKEGPDYRAAVLGEGFEQVINLEIKTLGTPKTVRDAVNALLRETANQPSVYGLVIAPYISPGSAAICKAAGIGFIDLSGNCHISFRQVFISREKAGNQHPFKSGLNSIYAPKSERVLRVMLTTPYRPWKTIELANEAGVSPGMITQVGKKLIEQEWAIRSSQGISLVRPENLLEDWVKNYSLKRNTLSNFYTIKPLQEIELNIARICDQLGINYALTGFSACNRLAPWVRGQRAMLYVNNDIDQVAAEVGLKSVESGVNVTLIQPYDAGVFWNRTSIETLSIASPIQVYLDLKRYPGRGEEAADFLFKGNIEPIWQQLKMNTIVS